MKNYGYQYLTFVNNFNSSQLKDRVLMMNRPKSLWIWTKYPLALLLMASVTMAFVEKEGKVKNNFEAFGSDNKKAIKKLLRPIKTIQSKAPISLDTNAVAGDSLKPTDEEKRNIFGKMLSKPDGTRLSGVLNFAAKELPSFAKRKPIDGVFFLRKSDFTKTMRVFGVSDIEDHHFVFFKLNGEDLTDQTLGYIQVKDIDTVQIRYIDLVVKSTAVKSGSFSVYLTTKTK